MKTRKLNRRHRTEFVLDYYAAGRRVRKWFRSRVFAEAEASALKEQKRVCGEAWTDLSPAERSDIMLLMEEARREGVTLRQVWEAFKTGKLDTAPLQRRTLRQAVEETIAAKQMENLRDRYIVELGNYLWKFTTGRSEMFVDRVTVADIEKWFDERGEALSTRRSNLGRLGSLFDVCWRRGYIKENPCLRVTPPKLDEEPPVILTPDEAKALLKVCHKSMRRMVPYVALGMFGGIRPEELEKLTWGDVDMDRGTVKIDAAASKVRRRRTVTLHPTALAWLKTCQAGRPDSPITPQSSTLRRDRRALADKAGVVWQQDILRHSAGSYLLALHQDAGKVAFSLGNSARILEKHYKDIVTADGCMAFWALVPEKCASNPRNQEVK